jgi:hypothetical protein
LWLPLVRLSLKHGHQSPQRPVPNLQQLLWSPIKRKKYIKLNETS